jgi:GTPase SAR1 family protein
MKTIIRDAAPDENGELWELKPRIISAGPSVLVIGPDRVGKTTLVGHISRKTGIPSFKCPAEKQIFKSGGRSSLAFDYTLTHFLAQTKYRFISDRAYPCEWVYSQVFDRGTDMELLRLIDDAHANMGTKILLVQSSVVPEEEDDLVSKEDYGRVWQQYGMFRNWTNCEVVAIDTVQMLRAYRDGGDISEYVADEAIELMGLK